MPGRFGGSGVVWNITRFHSAGEKGSRDPFFVGWNMGMCQWPQPEREPTASATTPMTQ
jgi:hypothetical protein